MLTSCLGFVFAAGLPAVHADTLLPSGGTVAAGAASILQSSPSSTVINQQSRSAIINWQNFSVGSGASVTFQQPDSGAITLNRVTGGGLSAIDGSVLANGQVWLINRNGVLFGQGSHIDVGGLLATTSDIKDADFLSGHYAFGDASQNGQVINRGSIKAATGGSVVLSGAHVVNEGAIAATLGHVVLGGAKTFSVDFDGDNLIRYQITAPVTETPKDQNGKPATALVENSGTIAAQGGQVLMTARAARDVVDHVINTTGIIQADTVSVHNGEVVLDAGDGDAAVAGTVAASGLKDGETGGTISVRGEKIAIADGARLDASGQAGGGTVSIGDQAASSVSVGNAVITADAVKQGQGGAIAIISSGATKIASSLSAKGVSGGGKVETSGTELDISDSVRVDTSTSAGTAGLWLLDPVNVIIDTPTAATITGNLASTSVSVTASNDIAVNASINYSSANSLTLLAGHNLTVSKNVQNSGSGAIFVAAGWDGVTAAAAILTTPGAYGQGGGSVLIGGAGASGGVALGSRNGATTVAAGNLSLTTVNGYAQLGYHVAPAASVDTGGDISVQLTGSLSLDSTGGFYAQIGQGGRDSKGNHAGNISVGAQGAVSLTGMASTLAYARIGNGGASAKAADTGNIVLAAGADVTLGSNGSITTTGAGDALVIAAAGNFINQSGSGALAVSGGGRWLVFLNAPANNTPGALSASPFYNRAFNFAAKSYAPVAGAGNRFVYALAPVLTVTADGQAKIYGSANPTLTATISGALPGDGTAGVSGAAALSTTAVNNSGVGNYAIAAGLGTLVSDFNYGFQFVSGTLRIDPALLTASLTGTIRKTYDGTAVAFPAAANYQLSGVLFSDSVNVSGSAAAYSDKNAGTAKTVTVSGLTLSGADAGNYILASPATSAAIGVIDPASLTASLTGVVRKTYDGSAAATLAPSNYGLTGVIAGDSVTLNNPAAGSYNNKNVGTGKTVTVGGLALLGTDAGNYLLASSTVSANIGVIDPAALTATASLTGTARKTYDGSATANLTPSNYALAGMVPGDVVALNNPATGVYSDKNVGTAKTVTVSGLALSGADAGNYLLTSSIISANIGVIDPAILTASLAGTVRKIYDGTAAATLTPSNYALAGAVAGDSVALNSPAIGSYNNKNVGTGKTVTVGGLALSGADAGNYLLASSTISANIGVIDPAVLTATATASLTGTVRKTYDGTTTAFLTPSNYALAGVAAGDVVALNNPATGSFSDKNVGSAKTVTVTGLALSGANAGNYLLASSTISANIGVIDPAILTASLTGTVRKTYDGNTNAALTASNYGLTGIVAGDSVALNNPATGSYNNKAVGTAKTVTVGGLALSGADAGNYALNSAGLSANIGVIDPATLTVLLSGTVQKIFDGNTVASLDASNYAVTGLVAGDDVTLNNPAQGSYDTQFIGTGKTITVGGLALSGADAGNYILSATSLSDVIGVILVNRAPDILGNSFTSGAVQAGGQGAAPTGGATQGPSDATADTGVGEQSDSASFALGKSLTGSSQSTSTVLIDGLLRQFTPAPGSNLPHGIPPFGQVYSSWGNEAFWQ